MSFDREAMLLSLASRATACSDDELRVIDRVLAGIEQGRNTYGPLDVARDVRGWQREAAMELRDWLFYAAASEVARDARDQESAPEVALSEKTTRELALCSCGHPVSTHVAATGACLVCGTGESCP
jgi:hypothetical protein